MDKTVLYTEKPRENAKLTIFDPAGNIAEVKLAGPCVIGRKFPESTANIQIDCAIASRRHGEIAVMEGAYYYRDTDSLNGTYINDALYGKEAKKAATRLENGDVLRIDQAGGTDRHPQSLVMIFAASYSDTAVWEDLHLTQNVFEVNIGRAVGAAGLMLSDEMVSNNHATFYRWSNGWAIADHKSTNGVFVNNIRISAPTALRLLDVVRIADTHFIYTGHSLRHQREPVAKPGGSPLVIRITERTAWQRFKKMTLLQNINLTVNSGEMVMILGGSGAGKTTFMNAVMGYEKADGQIFHGHTDVYNEYDQMKYEIGYVPQQDLLRGSDTVYATICNAADMKLPRQTTPAQRTARIEDVLGLLGLQREQDSLVSKLSGGQRKRLSIAVEFIADPSLFFLDEPDSGLDGIMARSLNDNLRTIADRGKIVMVITHSPDRIAHLYDKVIVLAKSAVDNCGYLAYYGPVKGAFEFFKTDSLEGVVKRINRPDEGGDGMSDHYIRKYAQLLG
jgi:ABC-type multidrug transport system ATPase subunit